MSLDVGRAIREGIGRMNTPMGRQLVLVFLVVRFLSTVVSHTLTAANRSLIEQLPTEAPPIPVGPETTPFALPLPIAPALFLTLAMAFGAEAAHIAAVRFVVADDYRSVTVDDLTHRLGWTTLRGFIAGIIAFVAVTIGLVLFVLPGIFLAISFLFVRQEIAVRDVSVIDALADSWSLTAGNRVEVAIVLLVLVAVGVVASLPGFAAAFVSPVIQSLVAIVISTATTVFGIGVVSRAYAQLNERRAERFGLEDAAEVEQSRGP